MLIVGMESTSAKVWKVGPTETYKFCSAVVSLVGDGDTINIAAADYINDAQVQWTKNNLLIRGVGGRPRLFAGDLIANDPVNGKGIFVVKGNYCTIENIDFRNAKCLSHNGAGVRQEGSNVTIRHCRFEANEMGILGGGLTTLPNSTYIIEYCEFLNGGSVANPGYQHNIYINHIDSFIFRYNWSYDAIAEGHELKSRANHTYILYNRISNISSIDSRNIDIPNGGTAIIMGNIIEQGQNSSNSNMVAYGMEGCSNPGPQNIFVCYNTFVNKKDKGSFIQVPVSGCDTLWVKNNILAGAKTGGLILGTPLVMDSSHNYITDFLSDLRFANTAGFDYHLTALSPVINRGAMIQKTVKGRLLQSVKEYKDTCNFKTRSQVGVPDIGAFEYGATNGVKPPLSLDEPLRFSIQENTLRVYLLKNKNVRRACVYTTTGKCVHDAFNSHNTNGKTFELDMKMYPAGVYTVVLELDEGATVFRIVLD